MTKGGKSRCLYFLYLLQIDVSILFETRERRYGLTSSLGAEAQFDELFERRGTILLDDF